MPTLVVKRLIMPGHSREYEHSLAQFIDHVELMDGYMGVNIARPARKDKPLYIFTAKFDTEKHLQQYKDSEIRKHFINHWKDFTQKSIAERTIKGLDWWFASPGDHIEVPKYKMIVVSFFAAYPLVYVINIIFNPYQDLIVLAGKILVVVSITIVVMNYFTIPLFLGMFKKWLYVQVDE